MGSYGKIKNIYNALQDEQSKCIFESRLMYSLSGNQKYMNDMVITEMNRYREDDIMIRLIKWISGKSVWVFGAGFAGQQIVHTLKLYDIDIKGMIDNDNRKWGKTIFGIPVASIEHLNINDSIVIGTNFYRDEIKSQLMDQGMVQENIFVPDNLWWLGRDCQYYDRDIIKPLENEVFIDGGSLDGLDSLNFAKWCNGFYDAIYAFEPDQDNISKMLKMKELLHDFHIVNKGMWSKDTKLRFSSGEAENCVISDDGDVEISVTSLDKVLGGKLATYIKMDIEGSELEALCGAEKTIQTYMPRLAVCVYHKPEDIVDIPNKILEMNPNYKLFLRHYSYLKTETVLYAIQ